MNTAQSFFFRVSCVAAICLFTALTDFAQQTDARILKKALFPPFEPVPLEISNLKVNGTPINFDQPFQADDEWLKGLTFDVKNVSGKVITHFRIELSLHNPDNNQRAITYMVFHGRDTGLPNVEATAHVADGEIIHASFDEKRYNGLKRTQEHIGLSKITNAEFSIAFVIFEGDTAWRLGNLLRRDPTDPMRWNVIRPERKLPN